MRIRICTYNCKNFFDSCRPGNSKPARERRALAKTIDQVDADILCLQEVQSEAALEELNETIGKPYDYYLLEEGNSNRGINVAMMSRFSFEGQTHKNIELKDENGRVLYEYRNKNDHKKRNLSPALFQRDLFLSGFRIGGKDLFVFNTHLKSRNNYSWFNNDADTIRLAESSMAQDILSDYLNNPQNLVMLTGDLNERHEHKTLKPLTKWAELHDPVLDEIVSKTPCTATYHSTSGDRIDYLLLSRGLRELYQAGSARIHKSRTATVASDHLPVSVDVVF